MSVSTRLAMHRERSSLSSLNDDAKSIIVSFLVARDIVYLQRCSKDWSISCRSREVWAHLVAVDFEPSQRTLPLDLSWRIRDVFVDSRARFMDVLRRQPKTYQNSVLAPPLTEHPYMVYRRHVQTHRARLQSLKEELRRRELDSMVSVDFA